MTTFTYRPTTEREPEPEAFEDIRQLGWEPRAVGAAPGVLSPANGFEAWRGGFNLHALTPEKLLERVREFSGRS